MTKSVKHKRTRKENLKKIKLKVGKTLKKAQNETKTDFKARKIIMKEQLADRKRSNLLTKKNLDLKELTSRLFHHSIYVIQDGLNGIKELVIKNIKNDLVPILATLFKTVNPYILNTDHFLRVTAIKIIELIIIKVGSMAEPYFHFLASHLSCAMVHLNTGVQSDSLQLMDVLLSHAGSLLAQNCNIILNNFLMLISRKIDSTPNSKVTEKSYTLISNPSSKLATIKWRVKLLRSLSKYLAVILGEKSKFESSIPSSNWQVITMGSLPPLVKKGNKSFMQETKIQTECKEIKPFSKSLLPLIFDTWTEVEASGKYSNDEDNFGMCLDGLAIDVLKHVLEIVLHLWSIVEMITQTETSKCIWFTASLKKEFKKGIFEGFPYSPLEGSSYSNEKGGDKNRSKILSDCHDLNVTLASLIFLFKKQDLNLKSKVTKYFIDALLNIAEVSPQKYSTISSTVCSLLKNNSGLSYEFRENLLKAGLTGYQSISSGSKYTLLSLPLQASDFSSNDLWNSECLRGWVAQIVADALENPKQEALLDIMLQFKLRKTSNFVKILSENKQLLKEKLDEARNSDPNPAVTVII